MTTTLKYKEYKGLDGKTYFVEQYKEKEWKVPLWRYGYFESDDPTISSTILSDMLRTRPNLKRLNLI